MSIRVKRKFSYIAHIQGDDGHTIELAGSTQAWSSKHVYSELSEMAVERNGWLVAQHITECEEQDDEAPWCIDGESTEIKALPAPIEEAGEVDVKAGTVFGAEEYFSEWTNTYEPASLITYKETG